VGGWNCSESETSAARARARQFRVRQRSRVCESQSVQLLHSTRTRVLRGTRPPKDAAICTPTSKCSKYSSQYSVRSQRSNRLTVTRVTFLIWRHRLTVSDPCSVRDRCSVSFDFSVSHTRHSDSDSTVRSPDSVARPRPPIEHRCPMLRSAIALPSPLGLARLSLSALTLMLTLSLIPTSHVSRTLA
jgi:hypothetical protein